MNELIEKFKKLGFDNYLLVDFLLKKEVVETKPKDGWRCWKSGNEVYLNITLRKENEKTE